MRAGKRFGVPGFSLVVVMVLFVLVMPGAVGAARLSASSDLVAEGALISYANDGQLLTEIILADDSASAVQAVGIDEVFVLGKHILYRYDADGTLVWQASREGEESCTFHSFIVDKTGAATVICSPVEVTHSVVMRFDADGQSVWEAQVDVLLDTIVANDTGDVVVAGVGEQHLIATCLSDGGDVLWSLDYSDPDEELTSVVAATPGANGRWHFAINTASGYFVANVDEQGSIIRSDDLDAGDASALAITARNGFIYVAGSIVSDADEYAADLFLVSYDEEGEERFFVSFETVEEELDTAAVAVDDYGNIILAGTVAHDEWNYLVMVANLDSEGNIRWRTYFGPQTNGSSEMEYRFVGMATGSNVYFVGLAQSCPAIIDGSVIPQVDGGGNRYWCAMTTFSCDAMGELVWYANYDGNGTYGVDPRSLGLASDGTAFALGQVRTLSDSDDDTSSDDDQSSADDDSDSAGCGC